ncbi:MAG: hypothetical protein ACI8WT_004029 [Clostridium sp.]|jgi:hypothetical protein
MKLSNFSLANIYLISSRLFNNHENPQFYCDITGDFINNLCFVINCQSDVTLRNIIPLDSILHAKCYNKELLKLYYISMLMVIVSGVFYHISQKSISKTLNPMISMMVTYSTAVILTFILFLIFPIEKNSLSTELNSINWASFLLGFAIVGMEIGFLFVYRSGWNISVAAICSNVAITMLLISVGIYFFKYSRDFLNK